MEQLQQLDFSEEMKNSYRDYAISVIIARALPDVRDGLKPVQRRILYAMNELGLDPKKPHRKSARIVGDTMGKYHPHGDSSIYDALVHMSEDYTLSIPLVDGHGNFGSIDGDPSAAMRYTEARLSEGGMTLLENLDKDLVDFIPNFDESEKEPTVLPAMIPNLLINGTTGIAVGMATNIPPHNAGEVINACIAYLDNPAIPLDELLQIMPGPDFPTGGVIVNGSALKGIYETGEGRIRIRAKTVIEKGEYGRTNIVITEIPFTASGTKTKLVEGLVGLMRDKVFEEIYDVRDESSKEGYGDKARTASKSTHAASASSPMRSRTRRGKVCAGFGFVRGAWLRQSPCIRSPWGFAEFQPRRMSASRSRTPAARASDMIPSAVSPAALPQ
jgi:DNA gyrase subunit A